MQTITNTPVIIIVSRELNKTLGHCCEIAELGRIFFLLHKQTTRVIDDGCKILRKWTCLGEQGRCTEVTAIRNENFCTT